ncbi:MAG TPA: flagellar assembly protein FliH [Rubrivivax sp.]|nr:flagellar assembly protein FliH [Rubrivivax sp.]
MSKPSFKNVPPPPGSRAGSTPYQRFIPREELGDFASWQPGTFGAGAGAPVAPPAAAAAPEPTAADWEARIGAARQAGYQDGYRDGLVALESFKASFAQQATSQIGALLDAFEEQLGDIDAQVAQQVTAIAVQLARQVLRTELVTRPELVAQVATEAVNAVMLSARHISVQVHPLDLPLVAEGAEEALQARRARLMANPAIQRGGVLVQSEVGAIDARIASRWAQACTAMGSELPLDDLPA